MLFFLGWWWWWYFLFSDVNLYIFIQVSHRMLAKFQNNSWKCEGMKKYIIEILMRNKIYIFNGYGYHSFEQIIKEGLFFRFPDVFSSTLNAFPIDK